MGLSKATLRYFRRRLPEGKPFTGKTVLITGANSGIGFKVAETMVFLGASIIMACRNPEKAKKAKELLSDEYPGAVIALWELDLASFDSIDAFVARLEAEKPALDAFVNNAGVFCHPDELTEDGLELVMGTNYIGTVYLTGRILPYLLNSGRQIDLINTISIGHKLGRIDFDDFYGRKHYKNFAIYASSKLCLAKYTYRLATQTAKTNVRITMNHPGAAVTPIAYHTFGDRLYRYADLFSHIINSAEKSSLSVALQLSDPAPAGSITGPVHLFGSTGYPHRNLVLPRVKRNAGKLIDFTNSEILKLRPDFVPPVTNDN